MTMRRLACATMLCVGIAFSMQAMGQGFSGPYANVGIGFKSSDLESSDTFGPVSLGAAGTQSGSSSGSGGGQANFFGSIAAGWNWNPAGPFVLGLGVFADLGSSTVSTSSFTDITTIPGGTFVFAGSGTAKQKNRYGIAVEPGYEFTPRTVGYLKLSWNWSKYEFTDSDTTDPLASFSTTYNGIGYGVGLKHLVTDHAFAFVEWVWVDYGSKSSTVGTATTTIEPGNTLALVGIGWQF